MINPKTINYELVTPNGNMHMCGYTVNYNDVAIPRMGEVVLLGVDRYVVTSVVYDVQKDCVTVEVS